MFIVIIYLLYGILEWCTAMHFMRAFSSKNITQIQKKIILLPTFCLKLLTRKLTAVYVLKNSPCMILYFKGPHISFCLKTKQFIICPLWLQTILTHFGIFFLKLFGSFVNSFTSPIWRDLKWQLHIFLPHPNIWRLNGMLCCVELLKIRAQNNGELTVILCVHSCAKAKVVGLNQATFLIFELHTYLHYISV